MAPEAMESVLAAARRSSDLVVVDLPRRTDPASEVALHRGGRDACSLFPLRCAPPRLRRGWPARSGSHRRPAGGRSWSRARRPAGRR